MKRILVMTILILSCLLYCCPLTGYAASNNSQYKVPSKERISELMKEYDVHSCSITYSINNQTVFSGGFGDEDILATNKVSDQSVFEAGSNGKMIAAYICVKLANQGKINLDNKITKYLNKDWVTDDPRFKEITVAQLLSHSAGFSPSYEFGIDKNIYFKPGSQFSYSGVGYMYLQKIIEHVTNLSFNEAANKYAFRPLHMHNSTFSTIKTVTPFIKISSLIVYTLTAFVTIMLIILLLGFFIGALTKFRYSSKRRIFYISIICAAVLNVVFISILISKLLIIFAIFIIIAMLILLITRNRGKWNYIAFSAYTATVLILGIVLPISIPTGRDIITKEPNCAYSLKSTSKDMSLFSNELLNRCQDRDSMYQRMFLPAINIDNNNSWGLGVGIEKEKATTTYWDSGINPGFQSLVVIDPHQNASAVVLTNSDNGLPFSKEVIRMLLNVNGTWEIRRAKLK